MENLYGVNNHHIISLALRFGKILRAINIDEKAAHLVPSTKGVLRKDG